MELPAALWQPGRLGDARMVAVGMGQSSRTEESSVRTSTKEECSHAYRYETASDRQAASSNPCSDSSCRVRKPLSIESRS